MAKYLRIVIDAERLRENLSRADGRDMSADEIERWLRDAGFEPTGTGWVVREADLGQLDPSEVISVEDVVVDV
jgi:hypothetical protein